MERSSHKKYILLILVFLIVSCGVFKNSKDQQATKIVEPKQLEISKILAGISDEVRKMVDLNEAVLVIRIDNLNEGQKIDITIYNKKDFGWKLRETKEVPYGTFNYNSLPVVIFGQSCDRFFTLTKKTIFLEWLKPLPPLTNDKMQIPKHFDPPVWNYEYLNGNFTFKGVGY